MSREDELLNQIDEMREERRLADAQWRNNITNTLNTMSDTLAEMRGMYTTCSTRCSGDMHRVNESIQALHAEISQANVILTGNGTPEKGLVVRVDRVEQEHKIQSRWFWVVVPSAITGLASAVWHYFKSP